MPGWVLALGAGGCAAAVACLLAFGSYTRRTEVVGQLVPSKGLVVVVSPVTGTLGEVKASEGMAVRQGEVLAEVRTQRALPARGDLATQNRLALESLRQGIEDRHAAQARLIQADAARLDAQARLLALEIEEARKELAIRRDQHASAEALLVRQRELGAQGYLADAQVRQAEAAVLDRLAAAQETSRSLVSLQRQHDALLRDRQRVDARLDELEAGRRERLAELDVSSAESLIRHEAVVTSAVGGLVSAEHATSGQTVEAGQALFSVLPDGGSLQAHLAIPSSAIGLLEVGDEVRIRLDAFPYQKFGHHRARIIRISRSAMSPQGQGQAPVYRAVAELDSQTVLAYGKHEPLLAGMTFKAHVLGDSRRLWEWLLEPLFSLSGSGQD